MMTDQNGIDIFAIAGEEAGRASAAFCNEYVEAFTSRYLGIPDGITEADILKAAFRDFGVFYQHTLDAAYDKYGIPQDTAISPETPETSGRCENCWCNTCAGIDACTHFPAADGITPPPCAACWQTEPLVPKSAPPPCGAHEKTPPKDCRQCWCWECAAFEDCVVEKPGFDADSKPCPCDACAKGDRWMPKENPPCNNYQPGTAREAAK